MENIDNLGVLSFERRYNYKIIIILIQTITDADK